MLSILLSCEFSELDFMCLNRLRNSGGIGALLDNPIVCSGNMFVVIGTSSLLEKILLILLKNPPSCIVVEGTIVLVGVDVLRVSRSCWISPLFTS